MPANTTPIFTRVGNITRAALLKTAANDYTGVSPYNKEVFAADATNGGFLQRLRFKAVGANVATVARIYLNDGDPNEAVGTAPAALTGTPSASGGTILSGTYYGVVIAVMANGALSPIGTISSGVAVTGPTGSIAWSWTAVAGAVSYRLYVGATSATEALSRYFTTATNSYSQTAMHVTGTADDNGVWNCKLYGEISLPATIASTSAATVDIDYPMNFALPPGWKIYVGLGTTVAAGWVVTPIGGDY